MLGGKRRRGESLKASEYNMVKFALVLYNIRVNSKATQAELAEKAGVSQSQWARYELGSIKQISIEFVNKVCQTFNIDKNEWLVPVDSIENKFNDIDIFKWSISSEAIPYIQEAYQKYLSEKEI